MNKKALYFGIGYSITAIAFKLFIVLGGYALSTFGYFYSSITSVLLIVPFYYFGVKNVRDKDYNGLISGRDAVRICLTIFAIGAVLISVYNYLEFELSGKAMAIDYYHGDQFMKFLKSQSKIKPESYQKIIAEQIEATESSSFKATTGKLFSYMFLGLTSAFIMAASMKKSIK